MRYMNPQIAQAANRGAQFDRLFRLRSSSSTASESRRVPIRKQLAVGLGLFAQCLILPGLLHGSDHDSDEQAVDDDCGEQHLGREELRRAGADREP